MYYDTWLIHWCWYMVNNIELSNEMFSEVPEIYCVSKRLADFHSIFTQLLMMTALYYVTFIISDTTWQQKRRIHLRFIFTVCLTILKQLQISHCVFHVAYIQLQVTHNVCMSDLLLAWTAATIYLHVQDLGFLKLQFSIRYLHSHLSDIFLYYSLHVSLAENHIIT